MSLKKKKTGVYTMLDYVDKSLGVNAFIHVL